MISMIAQALLHSLWQIAMLAMLLWFLLKLISKQNSKLRYGLSLTCLYSVPILFLTTCILLSDENGRNIGYKIAVAPRSNLESYIVWLWLIGAVFPTFKLLKNSNDLRRILCAPKQPVPEVIHNCFSKLLECLAIRQHVTLCVSEFVTGACAAVYWKPIILLPPAYLTQLSIDEIEAIIAHELAHIKQHDGLHRLLQVLIDAAFYYHPYLIWISRQVSTEREHACDDLAATLISDRQNLATGLLKAQLVQDKNTLVLAAQSHSYKALDRRIRRLVPLTSTASRVRRSIAPYVAALILFVVGFGTFIAPPWQSQVVNHMPDFSKATLVSLKDDVCNHIGKRELYWTPPYDRKGAATIQVTDHSVFMNGHQLPAEDQLTLRTVFENYRLSSFSEVRLRYYGDEVKLIVSDNEGGNHAPYVYLVRSGSDSIDAFHLQERQSS